MICTRETPLAINDLADFCKCDELNHYHIWSVVIREATFEEYWVEHAEICLKQASKEYWQKIVILEGRKFYEVSDTPIFVNKFPLETKGEAIN